VTASRYTGYCFDHYELDGVYIRARAPSRKEGPEEMYLRSLLHGIMGNRMGRSLSFPKEQLTRLALIIIIVAALLPLPLLRLHAVNVHGQQTYSFTIIVDGSGYLSVNGSPTYPKTPPGTYVYEAGTVLDIQWVHTRDPGGGGSDLDHYEVNGVNIGLPPAPFIIVMNADYVLKAVFVPIVPISFSLSPLSATVHETDSVTFVATTNGKGVPPIWLYWYLNGTMVNWSNDFSYSHQWTLGQSEPGVYQIYVTGTDSWEAVPPSEWKKSEVATVRVQGVKIKAYCSIEDADVSVDIMMDGSPTGYMTPHTFEGLSGIHTFAVQPVDPQGHAFRQWSTGETNTTMTISADGTYTALYPAERVLAITSTIGGTTNPTTGSHIYNDSTIVNVTAQSNMHYYLDHWELDGISVGDASPVSVRMDADHVLKAVFRLVRHSLNITTNEGGNTNPAVGTSLYEWGTVVSVTAMPDSGYYLDEWRLDNVGIGIQNPLDVTMDRNHTLDAVFRQLNPGHDVAVKWITSKTIVGQGYRASINVTAINIGSFTETFNISVFVNWTSVALHEATLGSGVATTMVFTWNTTGFAKDNYTINAIADTVPGETDTADNTLVGGTVFVGVPGDVNGNGKVDVVDLLMVAKAFGTNSHSPSWDPNMDVDCNNKADVIDMLITAKNYSKTST
jgi:hypothetical protein